MPICQVGASAALPGPAELRQTGRYKFNRKTGRSKQRPYDC
jgi:hypothetical protein